MLLRNNFSGAENTAPPLVLVHGFLGSPQDWDPLTAHLPNYPTLCVTLPGHSSTPIQEPLSELAPLPSMHLVGYSLGGRLALRFAEKYPEKIRSLTLISTHLGLKSEEARQKRLVHDAQLADRLRKLPLDLFLERWYAQEIFAGFKPDLTHRLNHNPHHLADLLMRYSLGHPAPLVPPYTTLITGARDIKFCKLYPEAHIIPDAGHMVHLEQPAHLAAFLTLSGI